MPYTHTTFSALKTQLAARMGDPGKVFWVDAELTFALSEALRVWNVLTLQNLARGVFTLTPGTAFYDLSSALSSIRPRTLRDRSVVSEIEYHLIEPQNFVAWTGTDQFTLAQITNAVQHRRNRFLADTAAIVSQDSVAVFPGLGGTVDLDDDVIAVRHAVYETSTGKYLTLKATDERTAAAVMAGWKTEGTPRAFSVSTTGPLQIQLVPPPADSGTLHLLVVRAGANVAPDAGGVGTLLGVPDDLAWGVKYGALSDLYSDDASSDPQLAEECERMYQLAVGVATNLPVVLDAYVNGAQLIPSTITTLDVLQSGWRGAKRGTPNVLAVCSPELVALSPIPSRDWSVTLNVVQTTDIPADGENVQVGRESLDPLLGYAQHVLTLKVGGPEHASTFPLFERFLVAAQKASLRSAAVSTLIGPMRSTSTEDLRYRPVTRPVDVAKDPDEVRSERNARRRSTAQ